jgi:hypothetical protein
MHREIDSAETRLRGRETTRQEFCRLLPAGGLYNDAMDLATVFFYVDLNGNAESFADSTVRGGREPPRLTERVGSN